MFSTYVQNCYITTKNNHKLSFPFYFVRLQNEITFWIKYQLVFCTSASLPYMISINSQKTFIFISIFCLKIHLSMIFVTIKHKTFFCRHVFGEISILSFTIRNLVLFYLIKARKTTKFHESNQKTQFFLFTRLNSKLQIQTNEIIGIVKVPKIT